ncbi:MAG: hypothetical protein JWN41_1837, partial [Thermoleophilia bacterium]|nr:hypothetical protein [Thermoleophilia bacterium]
GTIVDACESTTGWGYWGPYSAPAKSVDSVIFAQGTGSLKAQAREMYTGVGDFGSDITYAISQDSKTLSMATAAGGYVSLLVEMDWAGASTLTPSRINSLEQQVGGVWSTVSPVASETLTAGFVRYSWPVAASLTITGLRSKITQYRDGIYSGSLPFVRYDSITLSTSATTDTSIVKHFDVAGSARGPGSLHVAAPSDAVALDKIFVMTIAESAVAAGFRPDGARWLVSGSTYDVPVAMLQPGSYKIVALTAATGSPSNVSVVAQTRIGGTSTGPTSTAAAVVPTSPSPRFTILGSITLPPMPLQNPGATAFVRLVFTLTSGGVLTDFFMVPEDADYSIVSCGGTGTVSASGASSHLWIDSPTPDQPLGAYWRGVAADRTDARRMSLLTEVLKPSVHTFPPGPMLAFLKSTNANGPTLTLEHTPWWLGMPAS